MTTVATASSTHVMLHQCILLLCWALGCLAFEKDLSHMRTDPRPSLQLAGLGDSLVQVQGGQQQNLTKMATKESLPGGATDIKRPTAEKTAKIDVVLPKLEKLTSSVNRQAADAQMSAAGAEGVDVHKEAMEEFQSALRARSQARRMRDAAGAETKAAKRVMMKATTLAKHANEVLGNKDASVVRQRNAALEDLQQALSVEQENRDNNVKVEELKNKVASAKSSALISKEEVNEGRAKSKAQVDKSVTKVNAMSSKLKAALAAQKKLSEKLQLEKKGEKKNTEEAAAKKAHSEMLARQEQGKAKAAAEKVELLEAKKATKQQEARVRQHKELVKAARGVVAKVKSKATAAIKAASAAKDDSVKGLMKAQVASGALKRVRREEDVMAAQKKQLNTEVAELTRRKIEMRFLKLKHESRAQAHLEALGRAKKRAKKSAMHNEKREKSQKKADAKVKLEKMKVKAKKKYKREKAKARETEKEELAKAKSQNKLMKKATKQIEQVGAAAAKELENTKKRASQEKARKKAAKDKYLKKAKLKISDEFDKPTESDLFLLEF